MASAQHSTNIHIALDLLAELTGTQPHITTGDCGLTISAVVDDRLTAHWQRLVDVLELGSSYGMTTTATSSRVWLRFAPGDQPRP
ncbi:hypothetical protein [Streptomyces vinaceus]|uniref:hypothetical protein n=1 Tax=Streptomyces vinaceus TaxID=1960 RepID=UPI003814EFE1